LYRGIPISTAARLGVDFLHSQADLVTQDDGSVASG
jgi:hypothetical protein